MYVETSMDNSMMVSEEDGRAILKAMGYDGEVLA